MTDETKLTPRAILMKALYAIISDRASAEQIERTYAEVSEAFERETQRQYSYSYYDMD